MVCVVCGVFYGGLCGVCLVYECVGEYVQGEKGEEEVVVPCCVYLLEFYLLVSSNVTSGHIMTCDSTQS